MFSFIKTVRPLFSHPTAASPFSQISMGVFSRGMKTKIKTHRATYKRIRKTANGYKRAHAGKRHGNAGWSNRSLKGLSGMASTSSTVRTRLKKLLPYL